MSEAPSEPLSPAPSPDGFWRGVGVVAGREIEAYFDSPIAYVSAAVFLVLSGSLFMNSFFLRGVVDMGPYFEALPFLLVPFVPALTMRGWAEERAQHTIELLLTLPLHPMQAVMGKYLASLAFYLLILLGSLPIVAMLLFLGRPDLGLIVSSYLGAALLGAFFLAFGLCVSALTQDQIVAFVLAVLLGAFFVFSGHEKVVEVLDGLTPAWQAGTFLYESVSVMPQYGAFCRGVLGLGPALYFGLLSFFFVYLNEIALRRDKF